MSGLVYYKMFSPKEIVDHGEFLTKYELSTSVLRIARDHDGERERVFRLPLIENPDPSLFPRGCDITVQIRVGNSLVPNKRDPLYMMISDRERASIGFKVSESGPMKGAEGVPERYLDLSSLRGDDSETASLTPSDYPDQFCITLKPNQYWGTIFCTQGNGTKQCVGYGKKPDFSTGVYFDLYRDQPVEEYLIHYVEVAIYRDGLVCPATPNAAT